MDTVVTKGSFYLHRRGDDSPKMARNLLSLSLSLSLSLAYSTCFPRRRGVAFHGYGLAQQLGRAFFVFAGGFWPLFGRAVGVGKRCSFPWRMNYDEKFYSCIRGEQRCFFCYMMACSDL